MNAFERWLDTVERAYRKRTYFSRYTRVFLKENVKLDIGRAWKVLDRSEVIKALPDFRGILNLNELSEILQDYDNIVLPFQSISTLKFEYVGYGVLSDECDKFELMTFAFAPRLKLSLPPKTAVVYISDRESNFSNLEFSVSGDVLFLSFFVGELGAVVEKIRVTASSRILSVSDYGEGISFLKREISVEPNVEVSFFHFFTGGKPALLREKAFAFENSSFRMKSAGILTDKSHVDVDAKIFSHRRMSDTFYSVKTILLDRANFVFFGDAKVSKEAVASKSYLENHCLLLSPYARANTIPSMQIETNEVNAKHSASIGKVDEEQIFYMMTRGLDEETAKKMIIEGFVLHQFEEAGEKFSDLVTRITQKLI